MWNCSLLSIQATINIIHSHQKFIHHVHVARFVLARLRRFGVSTRICSRIGYCDAQCEGTHYPATQTHKPMTRCFKRNDVVCPFANPFANNCTRVKQKAHKSFRGTNNYYHPCHHTLRVCATAKHEKKTQTHTQKDRRKSKFVTGSRCTLL